MITFMITAGSLSSQDMIRILKHSRHDFSGKHLCDGYCMDIVSKKSKIVCSVKVFRLEFVPLVFVDQLQPNFYKLPCLEQKITKVD